MLVTSETIAVVLVGILAAARADSMIVNNGCTNSNAKTCDIILRTLTGAPEHECNIFSSPTRKCYSRLAETKNKASISATTTIYNSDGGEVLKMEDTIISDEDQENTPTASGNHIVPQSEWDLQPVFWKRRRRQQHGRRTITCKCQLKEIVDSLEEEYENTENIQRSTDPVRTPKSEGALPSTAGCTDGFQARYSTAAANIKNSAVIRRVAKTSQRRCAAMCETEFVTQIGCVGIAYTNIRRPFCILLSSLPKSANSTDYTVYTTC